MKVTNDMLKAAIEKAIEAGLLPKYARRADSIAERELIELVLQAALDARSVLPKNAEHRNCGEQVAHISCG